MSKFIVDMKLKKTIHIYIYQRYKKIMWRHKLDNSYGFKKI